MALTHAQVFERRKQVSTLLTAGLAPCEIAEYLKVERQTVYNDIHYIRSGRNPELSVHSSREIFAQVLLSDRARRRELWQLINETESSVARVFALRELRLADNALMRYAKYLAGAVKETGEDIELTPEECDTLAEVSMRMMGARIMGKRVIDSVELDKLQTMLRRFESLPEFKDRLRLARETALEPSGCGRPQEAV
jgi:hypothetical protein